MSGKIHVDSIDVLRTLEAAVGRFQLESAESLRQADAGIRHTGERLEEHRKYLNRQLEDREWEVKQAERALCSCLDDEDADCETERDELDDAKRAREDVQEKIETAGRLVNRLRGSIADFLAESKRFAVVKDEICPRARECLGKYASALDEVASIVAPVSAGAFGANLSNSMAGGGTTQVPDGGQGGIGFGGESSGASNDVTGVGLAQRFEVNDIDHDLNELMESYVQENPDVFVRGFKWVKAKPLKKRAMMATDSHGKIGISIFPFNDTFTPSLRIVSAMAKIKTGLPLEFEDEYAVEALWHEICHNRARGYQDLPSVKISDKRVVMEVLNQLVARHTYPEFLAKLGGAAMHFDRIMAEGYGYTEWVRNLRKVIGKLNLNEKAILPEMEQVLYNTSYGEIKDNLAVVLARMSSVEKEKILAALDRLYLKSEEKYDAVLDFLVFKRDQIV